jgi:hypothetical protein
MKIKESVLRSLLREIAVNGSATTVPDALPILPFPQMAVQLSQDLPPLEDPNYVPANTKELGRALAASAEYIDADKVEKFYSDFKRLLSGYNNV